LGLDAAALLPFAATVGPLAAVDLETTGLHTDPAAEILEIGIVLFDAQSLREGRVTTLEALVRPARPLPRAVAHLTGLADADLAGAPALGEVREAIARALAGRAIVAHNAAFERHFLSGEVARELERAAYLDTLDLLSLTHPDAPDLRLESFTRILLGSEEHHRALADALDTLRVVSHVARGAAAGECRYVVARRSFESFAASSPWLALLGKSEGLPAELPEEPQYLPVGESGEAPVPFRAEAIEAALRDEARGRRHFAGYRVREEQIRLARRFVSGLADGGVLLLEGGTGVGKSLAYLAAAIPFAIGREGAEGAGPVVVSTRTKLLQDQLLDKDIGAAARFLGHPQLRALSIKGRANYACERRLRTALAEGREPRIFEEDRLAYAALSACAGTRRHGELGTLPAALLRRYPPLRDLVRRSVSTRAEQCSREQCAEFARCAFGRKRRALGRAHLLVANHDLLLRWPPDYPAFSHVIADEAHDLADVADEVYAVEVQPDEVLDRFDEIFGRPRTPGRAPREGEEALLPARLRRAAERDAVAWRRALQQDLASFGRTLAELGREIGRDFGEWQLRPGDALGAAPALAEALAVRLEHVADGVESLVSRGEEGEPPGAALERNVAELRGAAAALRRAFEDGDDATVAGVDAGLPPHEHWRLALRLVSPAAEFHERFLAPLECFAGVSASLFVGGDAFAALGDLEVEERERDRLVRDSVPSPFPYATHMRVVALEPEGDLVGATADVLEDLARLLGGRTLGLFTSVQRMNEVAEVLSARLREEGIDVLLPRRASDDPRALVTRFENGAAVLLGSRRFWQGVDIPGDRLQAVVIEKLPFEVPTELRRRRELRLRQLGIDAFGRYALGHMLLNLKQMVGRLIRSEEDRGLVVIVEGRTDKSYFRRLREAIPGPGGVVRAHRADLAALLAEVGIRTAPEAV
jgi:ATP-dependent DNA helicase DinG